MTDGDRSLKLAFPPVVSTSAAGLAYDFSFNPPCPAGLYIHIPFCRTKCPYCHFFSTTDYSLLTNFHDALLVELAIYSRIDWLFDTIYIGGGTPSLLPVSLVASILTSASDVFSFAADREITMEINPGDADRDWLEQVRLLGVNRLQIGIQSFQERELAFLGRRHSPLEAVVAIENAYAAGFTNVGIDLIYGIPGGTYENWWDTLNMAVSFSPTHISCYELTIEDGTPLASRYQQGLFSLPYEELSWLLFRDTAAFLTSHGYQQYEVSNFARHHHRSRHNTKYWRHDPYLGLGPSAHSFLLGRPSRRRWNTANITDYMTALQKGCLPPGGEEILTQEQLAVERLFLGLRTADGIDISPYNKDRGTSPGKDLSALLEKLEREGLATIGDGHLRPTVKGLALADRLALELWSALENQFFYYPAPGLYG